jgi:hypothetical protein
LEIVKYDITESYDLLIHAVGYEARSRFIAESLADVTRRRVGLGFMSREVLSFQENRLWTISNGGEFIDLDNEQFSQWMESELNAALVDAESVALDVSSFSRDRLGVLVRAVWIAVEDGRISRADILYAPAEFDAGTTWLEDDAVASAELLTGFEGSWSDPERPLTSIVGLGYEPGRALGALELLEGEAAVAFVPRGVDRRYDQRVEAVNAGLLEHGAAVTVRRYNVLDGVWLCDELLRLLQGVAVHGRAALVPLGPKLFAAACCAVSLDHRSGGAAIWRISGREGEPAVPRSAIGSLSGFRLALA